MEMNEAVGEKRRELKILKVCLIREMRDTRLMRAPCIR